MDLSVADIAKAVKAECPAGTEDVRVTGFTWDSRAVAPGDLYIALEGDRVDGHDFAAAAVDAGAVAVLATRYVDAVAAIIVVPDMNRAINDLACYWRGCLGGTVIGLTGSSGKTTTKNLIRDVLSSEKSVVATKANQNNELGVPATLFAANPDVNAVVVEMGMRGRGQITELTDIAKPDWGLITNVGTSHIELLGSREEIARAKAELFEALPDGHGIAFVNAADDYAAELCAYARLEERGVQIVLYNGTGASTDVLTSDESTPPPFVWASDVSLDGEGRPTFTLNAVGFGQLGLEEAHGSRVCTLELRGLHNVSNACAAAAIGLASGMSIESCCRALESARPEKGRQVIHRTEGAITVVDDAYNANPDSMAVSLATFAALDVPGKRIAVLGDMLELGDFARSSHEKVGEQAAASKLDRLICVGDLAQHIAFGARKAGMSEHAIVLCANADEALAALQGTLRAGDAVLVKASHSIGLEHVVEGLVV